MSVCPLSLESAGAGLVWQQQRKDDDNDVVFDANNTTSLTRDVPGGR